MLKIDIDRLLALFGLVLGALVYLLPAACGVRSLPVGRSANEVDQASE